MYDTIRFMLKEQDLYNEVSFMEEIVCRIVIKSCSENRVVGHMKNMKVEVRGTILLVEGSLIKWFLGNNYARTLALWEIRAAINSLSAALNVPLEKAKVTRIDIAFNFKVKNIPWLYMTKLLYHDYYFRSSIQKETLYFEKYDSILCFYDKVAELKKCKDRDADEALEDLGELNVIRYEFRFLRVTNTLGVVRGECLYDSAFCLSLLGKWYGHYMDIKKGYDEDFSMFRFETKKGFELSCVAYCMNRLNMFEMLEEAYVRRDISSKNKYDIKQVMEMAGKILADNIKTTSLIEELTGKISNAYLNLKRRYSVVPERMNFLNKWTEDRLNC